MSELLFDIAKSKVRHRGEKAGVRLVSWKVVLGLSPRRGALDAPRVKLGVFSPPRVVFLRDPWQDAVLRGGVVGVGMLCSGWSPASKGGGCKPPVNIM